MNPRFSAALVMIAAMVSAGIGSGAGPGTASREFEPNLAKVVPLLADQLDLGLLLAGKASDRWNRAKELRGSLPALREINPLEQTNQLLSWLAVVAMIEGAVSADAANAPEEWGTELARIYRELFESESFFTLLAATLNVASFQPGGETLPWVVLSRQLTGLPAYGRQGFRWLAGRRLKANPGNELRRLLLDGLVEVNRREGDWQAMQMAAATLGDLKVSPKAAFLEAEALLELGRVDQAKQVLAKARANATPEDLQRLKQREELATLRAKPAPRRTPANLARTAELFVSLGERWRVASSFSAEEVLRAAHPILDETYIESLMAGGLGYQAAWGFGKRARGLPPTTAFLGRRIGAGLMMLFRELYGHDGKVLPDRDLTPVLAKDLELFRKADPVLAELTALYLDFFRLVLSQSLGVPLLSSFGEDVLRFHLRYPSELAGPQMAYSIGQIGEKKLDVWLVLTRYREAMGQKPLPREFLPVFTGVSIHRALEQGDPQVLDGVSTLVDGWLGEEKTAALQLWRAHLLAVRALLSEPSKVGTQIKEVAAAYQETMNLWSATQVSQTNPEILCDAAVSLVTLAMEGQDPQGAKALADQVAPICGNDPALLAVRAVLSLVAGANAKATTEARNAIAQVVEQLPSHQAKIQSYLWLGMVLEASADAAGAKTHFAKAAELLAQERAEHAFAPLAPDLRALVAFSGAFSLGASYSATSPFGLSISANLTNRMCLFPPAAVDDAKLATFRPPERSK